MERIFEFDFGETDKATGKPIIHEIHIDIDWPTERPILPLVSSYFEHKGWEADASDKKI